MTAPWLPRSGRPYALRVRPRRRADRFRLPRWWSFDGRRPAIVLNPGRGLAGARLSYARSCRLVAAVRRKLIPYPLRSRLSFLRAVFRRR